jgi:hypothetical protein
MCNVAPDDDLYVNAFSRTTGRILAIPLSQFARTATGVELPDQLQGASLVADSVPELDLITGFPITIPLTGVSQYPPLSFDVTGDEVFFNHTGAYRSTFVGTATSTPGLTSTLTVTAVPTGTTAIVGPATVTADLSMTGTTSLNYSFLTNITDAGSDVYFTATTSAVDSNVSILNGALDVIKIT